MSNKVRILIVIFLVIAGIVVMVYPSLSNYVNTIHSSYAVQELNEQLDSVDTAKLERQRELAQFLTDSVRFYRCQFIISTHSPFLLSLRDALNEGLQPCSKCVGAAE